MGRNRELKFVIYSLKRRHGVSVIVNHRTGTATVDPIGGSYDETFVPTTVSRAIRLPAKHSYKQFNRFHTELKRGDQELLIDKKDFPGPLSDGDYIMLGGKRLEVMSWLEIDEEVYQILVRNTQNVTS